MSTSPPRQRFFHSLLLVFLLFLSLCPLTCAAALPSILSISGCDGQGRLCHERDLLTLSTAQPLPSTAYHLIFHTSPPTTSELCAPPTSSSLLCSVPALPLPYLGVLLSVAIVGSDDSSPPYLGVSSYGRLSVTGASGCQWDVSGPIPLARGCVGGGSSPSYLTITGSGFGEAVWRVEVNDPDGGRSPSCTLLPRRRELTRLYCELPRAPVTNTSLDLVLYTSTSSHTARGLISFTNPTPIISSLRGCGSLNSRDFPLDGCHPYEELTVYGSSFVYSTTPARLIGASGWLYPLSLGPSGLWTESAFSVSLPGNLRSVDVGQPLSLQAVQAEVTSAVFLNAVRMLEAPLALLGIDGCSSSPSSPVPVCITGQQVDLRGSGFTPACQLVAWAGPSYTTTSADCGFLNSSFIRCALPYIVESWRAQPLNAAVLAGYFGVLSNAITDAFIVVTAAPPTLTPTAAQTSIAPGAPTSAVSTTSAWTVQPAALSSSASPASTSSALALTFPPTAPVPPTATPRASTANPSVLTSTVRSSTGSASSPSSPSSQVSAGAVVALALLFTFLLALACAWQAVYWMAKTRGVRFTRLERWWPRLGELATRRREQEDSLVLMRSGLEQSLLHSVAQPQQPQQQQAGQPNRRSGAQASSSSSPAFVGGGYRLSDPYPATN